MPGNTIADIAIIPATNTYAINPKFKLKYENKRIQISLFLNGLDKHFVYYVVPLFDKILNDIFISL